MTISSTVNSAVWTGNSATTQFDFTFRADNTSDLVVTLYDKTTGLTTTLAPSTYSIVLSGTSGGRITYPLVGSPIDSNTNIAVERIVPFYQSVDIVNQNGFSPAVVELALDRLTMQIQQLNSKLGRQISYTVGSGISSEYTIGGEIADGYALVMSGTTIVQGPSAATIAAAAGYASAAAASAADAAASAIAAALFDPSNYYVKALVYQKTETYANTVLYTKTEVDALIAAVVPPGHISYFAMNTAPTGYLKANGALVSRVTYSNLFSKIGTTYGVGDGSTTFGLPDLRGEFVRGWDDGRGVDTSRVFASAQSDLFKAHTHQLGWQDGFNVAGGGTSAMRPYSGASPETSQSTGGTETRPRNIALLACIKY